MTAPRLPRVLARLGACLLLATALVAASHVVQPAAADDTGTGTAGGDPGTVGVATRPASADGRPDGRTRLTYLADPGQTVHDQVLVGNSGDAPEDFTVYATDAHTATDGSFTLLNGDQTPTSVGAWVHFDEGGGDHLKFSLEPNAVKLVAFTVAFPATATPGDHVGGIVASVIQEGQQVNVDRRVATAVYARVSGDLQPQLTITNFSADYRGDWWNPFAGGVALRYTIENTGNVALAANLTAGVSTWFGAPATAPQTGGIPVVLPGDSASYEFQINGVGQWLYLNPYLHLSPFVDSDDKDAQLLGVTPTSRDTVTWVVPWTVLIALVIVAGIIVLRWWLRRRDAARAQAWLEYTETEARRQALEQVGAGVTTEGAAE